MKRSSRNLALIASIGGLLLAGTASAQFAKNEDAVQYRQAGFKVMANHMGRLAAMAKGEIPYDAAQAKQSAELINNVSQHQWMAFVPGSSGDGANLKDDPWKRADDFKKLEERYSGQAAKLVESTSSLDALRKQVGETGASCKACHDEFRKIL